MRENVYCTKVGRTRPDEMYIVGAHMDGHGWGEAANDDGSGTAIVMEHFDPEDARTVASRAADQRMSNPERPGDLNGQDPRIGAVNAALSDEDAPDASPSTASACENPSCLTKTLTILK